MLDTISFHGDASLVSALKRRVWKIRRVFHPHSSRVWIPSVLILLGGILLHTPARAVEPTFDFDRQSNILTIGSGQKALPVSLKCPEFVLDGKTVGTGGAPLTVKGSVPQGIVEAEFPLIDGGGSTRLEVRLFLEWSAQESILRKWCALSASRRHIRHAGQ